MIHELTEYKYLELVDSMIGLCDACGEERECTEPDAENYPCEACGAERVFGTEQLLIMGKVEITKTLAEES